MSEFKEKLIALRACSEAVAWVGEQTLVEAYATCERADWILWLAWKLPIGTHQDLVSIAAWCARRTLPHAGNGLATCEAAIEVAERWANEPTIQNQEAARAVAGDAARAVARAVAGAAGDAAWAVARAVAGDAAVASGDAAWAVARAAGAAGDAAGDAAEDAAEDAARDAAWAAAWAAGWVVARDAAWAAAWAAEHEIICDYIRSKIILPNQE